MKPTLKQSILGPSYILGSVQILFPFGSSPKLIMGKAVIPIDQPERFGSWDKPIEQKAYICEFHSQVTGRNK